MSKFSHFAVKKLYYKQSFNDISGNRSPLFLQIHFDQTYFLEVCLGGGGGGGVWHGPFLSREFMSGGLCPGVLSRGVLSGVFMF